VLLHNIGEYCPQQNVTLIGLVSLFEDSSMKMINCKYFTSKSSPK